MQFFSNNKKLFLAIFVVLIMVFSSAFAVSNLFVGNQNINHPITNMAKEPVGNNILLNFNKEIFSPVPAAPFSTGKDFSYSYNKTVSAMVTFSFNNQSRLNLLLSNLSNPNNSGYHKYLTRSEFASNFSVSQELYSQAVSYFEQQGNLKVKTYSDRISIEVTGPASIVGSIFNTSIVVSSTNSSRYFAKSAPELPSSIAPYISEVTGLSNVPINIQNNMIKEGKFSSSINTQKTSGYPTPVYNGNAQLIYGSDLQVAYDEQSLLNITYPTNEVIATILWAGTNSSGNPVGPFVPSDICEYYNATLPSYEPHPTVHGVPLNGAVAPGPSASYDNTGANVENTLDLEMVGSTAPGASIYNVYGPNATFESLNSALAFILNPNTTYSALNNVSVISNSWGGPEFNNTVWCQYLQEAQARGISVLASSGDSGDNQNSSKYSPNQYYPGDYVQFPAAMAYNDFGVTSVGGTTLTLRSNLHILNQTAWYESELYTGDKPAGSAGGISQVFKETSWQLSTEANNVLNGAGLGVPDISAIGNNTVIFLSSQGLLNACCVLGGTSVASPVEAGLVAEMNAILNHYNESNLGYLNPTIYSLANKQITPMSFTPQKGYDLTGKYNSTLPTLPFYNVMYGRNHVYQTGFGYNLVTGWGSIDAYNFTMYILNINRSSSQIGLKGVDDVLALKDLNVTSYFYNSTTNTYSTVNTNYNASIQENLFLANQFGAPLYWVQNVVYIYGSQQNGWTVSYTGWVIFPYYGQYPKQTVYEYNFPLGKTIFMPHTFNVRTWISNLTDPMHQTVYFQINSQILSLPVPGAAYIIDAHNYSYSWQGHTYYNGPYPDNTFAGGLNPQFGLVGGPSSSLGCFENSTSGTLNASLEPMGMNRYISANTEILNESVDQTGEISQSLLYTRNSSNAWTITVSKGSLSQGIIDFTPAIPKTTEIFHESGLPSGTPWSINVCGISHSSTSNITKVSLVNGTYSIQVGSVPGYFPSPSTYIISVNGTGENFYITFSFSANQTYIKQVSTIYPAIGVTLSGNSLNESYLENWNSFGMAYDNNTGLIFIPYISLNGTGEISVYNTSNEKFINNIDVSSYNAIFDPNNGYVYAVSLGGSLSIINPKTFTVEAVVHIDAFTSFQLILHINGDYLYSIGTSGISKIDLSTMSVSTVNLPSGNYPYYTVFNGSAYVSNYNSNVLDIVNFTTSSIKTVALPAGYKPISVVQYYGSELLIGGYNKSNELYNVSTGELSAGPNLFGQVTSSVYDSISGNLYLFSSSKSAYGGNITVLNPANGVVVATIQGEKVQLSPVFDASNQNLYVAGTSGEISDYSVQHFYKVSFSETGLTKGQEWYVNLSNGMQSGAVTSSSISFNLTNSTYNYTIQTSDQLEAPTASSGSFTVKGESLSEPVKFMPLYSVTFTESGLPSGNYWYVNITGRNTSGPILSGNSFEVKLINGTYTYSIGSIDKFYSSPASSFVVNGNTSSTVNISFTEVKYTVTFTESGLSAGVVWYLNSTGISKQSLSPAVITLNLTNGTYSFTISNLASYYAVTPNLSVKINGRNATESIDYEHWNYINAKVTPADSLVTINGTTVSLSSSGTFNLTLKAGTYSLVVSSSGYKTYYNNFTLNSGSINNLTINLVSLSSSASSSNIDIYAAGGLIIAVIAIAAVIAIIRKR